MKKLFLILSAVATLAACNRNASLEVVPTAEDNAIGFSAYASTSATKGTVLEASDLNVDGIGVFAFYQPSVNGSFNLFESKRFAAPNFMYNQKVTKNGDTWAYSPVKYWPNTPKDLLSFFAYAPYDANKTWRDLEVSVSGGNLTVDFSISDNVENQVDYLWAEPLLNQTNKITQYYGENINDTDHCLTFNFNHVTSKLGLSVTTKQSLKDIVYSDYWNDANTTIYIKDIVFEGLWDSFQMTYVTSDTPNGDVSDPTILYDDTKEYSLTLKPCAAARVISDGWTGPKNFLEADQYLFLAPQSFASSGKVTITYDVVTKVGDGNNVNDSKVTNVITKTLAPYFNGVLQQGKAYNLQFVIGMDDVDISAEIEEWEDVEDDFDFEPIPVPANGSSE